MKKSSIFMSIAAAAVVFGAYTIYSESSTNMTSYNSEEAMSYSISSLNEISPAAGTEEGMKDSSPMEAMEAMEAMEEATSQMMADAKEAKNEHHEKMHDAMQHGSEQIEAKCKEHVEDGKCMDHETETEVETEENKEHNSHEMKEENHGEHSNH